MVDANGVENEVESSSKVILYCKDCPAFSTKSAKEFSDHFHDKHEKKDRN